MSKWRTKNRKNRDKNRNLGLFFAIWIFLCGKPGFFNMGFQHAVEKCVGKDELGYKL